MPLLENKRKQQMIGKNKTLARLGKIARAIVGADNRTDFCNIAEGTHAGSVTMTAGADLSVSHLIVKASTEDGIVYACGTGDKPMGVALDEAESGEAVAVALPGCAGSTFMCIASTSVVAGATLYTAAGGKVSASPSSGSHKVGVAVTSATANCAVEVDPQGFGESAWQFASCGEYAWKGTGTTETLAVAASTGDIPFAAIRSTSGSAKSVSAEVVESGIKFTLDAAGEAANTKIAWMLIRKN